MVSGAKCRKISAMTRRKHKSAAPKLVTSALALNEREQTRHEQHKHVLNEAKNNAVAAN